MSKTFISDKHRRCAIIQGLQATLDSVQKLKNMVIISTMDVIITVNENN